MGWLTELAQRLARDAHVVTTINVAEGDGARTSVHSRQRVVQRNGETTVITETTTDEEQGNDRES